MAFAQTFSIGVIGGGALTNDFIAQTVDFTSLSPTLPAYPIRAYSTSKGYVAGGTLRVFLAASFAVEADVLYREMHFAQATVLPNGTLATVSPATVVTWEYPVLAEYRFKQLGLNLRPMLQLGPSFRWSGNVNGTSPSMHGITAGVGFEFNLRRLNIAPQLRYTRWAPDPLDTGASPRTKPDQLELLVGISWGRR